MPIDEFSSTGEPLRATVRDGEFVIYSVAENGIDEHAEIEWHVNRSQGKGDWTFRLSRSPDSGK